MLSTMFAKEKGFTIIELMVGMAVGLLVLLAVTSVYISTLKTSATTLNASRLNLEMSAMMNIMANDVRRAGYWGLAAANFMTPDINPFNAVEVPTNAGNLDEISALRVHSNGGDGSDSYGDVTYDGSGLLTSASVGSCITYTYDVNSDGLVDDNEEFGFRWDGWPLDRNDYDNSTKEGLLLMRTSNNTTGPSDCAEGNWLAVNEFEHKLVGATNLFKSGIIVTNLQFDLSPSSCLNPSEPDGTDNDGDGNDANNDPADPNYDPDEFDCYKVAPTKGTTPGDGSGNSTVESLSVVITLEAELASDPGVRATQTQTVAVRNYLIRAR